MRWILGIIFLVATFTVTMSFIYTRPLISADQALAMAKQQLRFMGYHSTPNLSCATWLAWDNHGQLFSLHAHRVYATELSFQPKPGGPIANVEVIVDARRGGVISVFSLWGQTQPVY